MSPVNNDMIERIACYIRVSSQEQKLQFRRKHRLEYSGICFQSCEQAEG